MESRNRNEGFGLNSNQQAADDAVIVAETSGQIEDCDLSQISPTDLDGITINRTKTGISPFVPIVKTPTYSEHSGTLAGYSIEIEDPSLHIPVFPATQSGGMRPGIPA